MMDIGDYYFTPNNLLGQGGFGHVFKGRHRYKNLDVAIKEVKKESFNASDEHIEREIKLLQELSLLQHENLVTLFFTCTKGRFVYFVMEYCNYYDLDRFLRRRGLLNEEELKILLKQLAAGYRILYEKNIVHRDLKPMNLLLHNLKNKYNPKPSDLVLKIADFGISRTVSNKTLATTCLGTPVYMAPEVWSSEKYDHRVDLWSIGIIVFECLFGKFPFSLDDTTPDSGFWENFKRRKKEPQIFFPKHISFDMETLIQNLLKRDPGQRMSIENFLKQFSTEEKHMEVKIFDVPVPEKPVVKNYREIQQNARKNFFKKSFTLKFSNDKSKILEMNGLNLIVNEERTTNDLALENTHVAYIPSMIAHVNSKNSRTYGQLYPDNNHFEKIKHIDIITVYNQLHEPIKKILAKTHTSDRIHAVISGEKRILRINQQPLHFMDFGCGRFIGFAASINGISVIYNGHRMTEIEYNLAKNAFGSFDVAMFSIHVVKIKEAVFVPFLTKKSIAISNDYAVEKIADFIGRSKIKWGFIFFERYKEKEECSKIEKEYESQLSTLASIEIGSNKQYMVLHRGESCTLHI